MIIFGIGPAFISGPVPCCGTDCEVIVSARLFEELCLQLPSNRRQALLDCVSGLMIPDDFSLLILGDWETAITGNDETISLNLMIELKLSRLVLLYTRMKASAWFAISMVG